MSLAVVSEELPSDNGLVGRVLGGRYRILELIGRGGMGVVYSARDEEGGPDVVVKFLGSEWTGDPDAAARFEREARRLGALQHPNIVRMIDCGHDDGRAYLVMEFVRGQPLAQRLRASGKLSVQAFVPIAAQILKGVGHAHSRGVVLRDIKASNVMLCQRKGRSDFVMLLDFGLAKRLEGDTPITREHVLGTAGYIAPESLSSEPTGLGVDVYALGVLFWYMLTGALPFDAEDDAAVLYKTVHSPVPDLRAAIGEGDPIPERLTQLVEQCLAKSPEDRPNDANAIVETLIDAVPARMFRLPRVSGAQPTALGEGNTGMIALTGINPSGKHPSVPHEAARRSKKRWGLWLAPVPLALAVGAVAYVARPPAPQTPPVAALASNTPGSSQVNAAARLEQPAANDSATAPGASPEQRHGGTDPAPASPEHRRDASVAAAEAPAPTPASDTAAEAEPAPSGAPRSRRSKAGGRRTGKSRASPPPETGSGPAPSGAEQPTETAPAPQPPPPEPAPMAEPEKETAPAETSSRRDVFMRADAAPGDVSGALMKPD